MLVVVTLLLLLLRSSNFNLQYEEVERLHHAYKLLQF